MFSVSSSEIKLANRLFSVHRRPIIHLTTLISNYQTKQSAQLSDLGFQVCQSERDGEIATKRQEMELAEEEDFGNTDWGRLRSFLWNTMEYPWTSARRRL